MFDVARGGDPSIRDVSQSERSFLYLRICVSVFIFLFKGTVPPNYNGQVVSLNYDDRHLVGHSGLGYSSYIC
jgi:hypothetical protein